MTSAAVQMGGGVVADGLIALLLYYIGIKGRSGNSSTVLYPITCHAVVHTHTIPMHTTVAQSLTQELSAVL